jgi:hypothetical protein
VEWGFFITSGLATIDGKNLELVLIWTRISKKIDTS